MISAKPAVVVAVLALSLFGVVIAQDPAETQKANRGSVKHGSTSFSPYVDNKCLARYSDKGKLTFVTTVSNSGQDICWVLVNKAGTRVYTVNNLPRDANDRACTVSVYDISGSKAEKPVEIGRLQLPLPGDWFVNNRMFRQPDSTSFQMDIALPHMV